MTGYRRMTTTVFAGAVLALGLATPTAAFASDYTSPPPSVTPQVLASQFERATVAEPKGETLSLTGSDVAEMALLGAGSVLVGVVVVRRGRRGTAPA